MANSPPRTMRPSLLSVFDDAALCTLRAGIGRFTSPADIDYAAAVLAAAHAGEPAAALARPAQA